MVHNLQLIVIIESIGELFMGDLDGSSAKLGTNEC